MKERIRPNICDNVNVGFCRHDAYQGVFNKYNSAMDAGFYVEAVSLIESALCDRLESLANHIAQSPAFSYSTLGTLTDYLLGKKQIELQPENLREVVTKIREWKDGRNTAIHELAKITMDDIEIDYSFDAKYKSIKEVAVKGKELFREINNELRKYYRSENKKP